MSTRRSGARRFPQLSPRTLVRYCPLAILLLSAGCATAPSPSLETVASASHPDHNADLERDDHTRHVPAVSCKLRNFDDECPPPKEGGAWESVIPAEGSAAIHNILGMQTVHATMLPSGRLLLVSGSSWRNRNGTQYYPEYPNPETPTGLFIRDEDPFRNEKLDEYYELVNNAAIYDPVANTFYRVPVPVPEADPNNERHFVPNDFLGLPQNLWVKKLSERPKGHPTGAVEAGARSPLSRHLPAVSWKTPSSPTPVFSTDPHSPRGGDCGRPRKNGERRPAP
jgi:hypothetical protein